MNAPVTPKQETPMAWTAMILGCFLWGSAMAVIKLVIDEYDPFFLVFCRMAFAFLVLTPIVFFTMRHVRIYRKKDWLLLILLAFCDPIGFFTFEALAMQYTSATQASMMWALAPMLNLTAAWIILKEKTTLSVILCMIVAIGGVMLLTAAGSESEHASNPILGNFLELLSLCGAAGFCTILRFLRGAYPALFVVWVQCLIATLVLAPVLTFDFVELPQTFKLEPFLILLYLSLVVSLGAQALSAYGLARIPIPKAAIFGNSIPIFGVLAGIILLNESLNPTQWLACGIVLGAVLVSQYFRLKSEKAEAAAAAADKQSS
ncbi:MAG: DMT family transporter [Desulfovibrionaceae bacterium]|nr:DMT family transporter [Desulfovibrionaceae bacterium]